ISNLPNWLTASTLSGTASTSPISITFSVNSNANGLAPNTYNATITFTNTTSGQGDQTRVATLTVNAAPPGALQMSPEGDMSSSGNLGGPFSPSSFQYQLSTTSGNVNYSISGLPSWLTPSSTIGTVTTSPTTVAFTVNANANALPAGSYSTTVTITNT